MADQSNNKKEKPGLPFILSKEEQEAVSALNAERSQKKGDLLLKEGEIPYRSFFIREGCVRQYYLKDGIEKTTAFFTENESIFATVNTTSPKPSAYYLECIEDTVLTATSFEQEREMYDKFPRFQAICRINTELQFQAYQERVATYMTSSPEERYLNLLETRSDLLNRVPQYQLASYLGVKPESLSRIRKRIANRQ